MEKEEYSSAINERPAKEMPVREEIAAEPRKEKLLEESYKKAERSARDAAYAIEAAEKTSGLPLEKLAEAAGKISFFDRWQQSERKIGFLLLSLEASLFDYPIKPGEIFDPSNEVKNLSRGDRTERRRKHAEFRQKLAFQKKGVGNMQEGIVERIRKNPDAPLSEMYEWVQGFGEAYGLTAGQKLETRDVLRRYAIKHRSIEALRYSSAAELCRMLFDYTPVGEVEVLKGPLTIYIKFKDGRDFTEIYARDERPNKRSELTAEMLKEIARTGGLSLPSMRIPGLEGAVEINLENSSILAGESLSETVFVHEEQHAIKKLFSETWRDYDLCESLIQASTPEEQERVFRRAFRADRENEVDRQAKDEILAYFKDGESPVNAALKLKRKKEEGGLYDFAHERKAHWRKSLDTFSFRADKTRLFQQMEEIYGKEYENLITTGLWVAEKLNKSGMSKEAVIGVLINEPLSKWLSVYRRLRV